MSMKRTTKRPGQKFNAAARRGRAWIGYATPEEFTIRGRGLGFTKSQREDMRATVRWLTEMLASEPPTRKR
jgi:hypothetical protein